VLEYHSIYKIVYSFKIIFNNIFKSDIYMLIILSFIEYFHYYFKFYLFYNPVNYLSIFTFVFKYSAPLF